MEGSFGGELQGYACRLTPFLTSPNYELTLGSYLLFHSKNLYISIQTNGNLVQRAGFGKFGNYANNVQRT